jgi:tRNA (guanine37-N1)-methyltransferase
MLAAKVPLSIAEKMRTVLKKDIDFEYLVKREGDYLFIPLKWKVKIAGIVLVDVSLSRREKVSKLDWTKILTKDELKLLPRAFDVIGDILVLELPDALKKKEKKIADAYLEMYRNIKTVVKKSAAHSGVFRTRKVIVLAGENRKETIHRESGPAPENITSTFSPFLTNPAIRCRSCPNRGLKYIFSI